MRLSDLFIEDEEDPGECGIDHETKPERKFSGDIICGTCGKGLGRWR